MNACVHNENWFMRYKFCIKIVINLSCMENNKNNNNGVKSKALKNFQ